MTELYNNATEFAHYWHDFIGQKRKYSGLPYWVHTDEVRGIIHGLTIEPADLKQDMEDASDGHDLLEDVLPILELKFPDMVEVFHRDYVRLFSPRARQMIVGLTDVFTSEAYPDVNRNERKLRERERVGAETPEVKTIKLADLISNTRSIVAEDPDFARVYLKEKFSMLPLLADGSPLLLQEASMQTIAGFNKLGMAIPTIY